jgi:hypothetical protein
MSALPMILSGPVAMTRHSLVAAFSKLGRTMLAIVCIALVAALVVALRYVLFEHFHGHDQMLQALLRLVFD